MARSAIVMKGDTPAEAPKAASTSPVTLFNNDASLVATGTSGGGNLRFRNEAAPAPRTRGTVGFRRINHDFSSLSGSIISPAPDAWRLFGSKVRWAQGGTTLIPPLETVVFHADLVETEHAGQSISSPNTAQGATVHHHPPRAGIATDSQSTPYKENKMRKA